MLKTELLEIIQNSENSGVEFKRDDIRPEQLAKEVVALANFQGGHILLGVEDDGSITGIQRVNLEEWVMNVFRDKIHPTIIPFYEEILLENNKRIAIISFPQGTSKPYVLRHNNREDIYIRIGKRSELASREQQARLFALGGILHPEVMPVAGTNINSLDKTRLDDYISGVLKDPEIPQTELEWEDRLIQLGFLVKSLDNKSVCTIAGLILFGISPRRYLKQAGLRVMFFAGVNKEYQAKLDEIFDGPLVSRWITDPNTGKRSFLDEGLLDKVIKTIRNAITEEEGTIGEVTMSRQKILLYPIDAIRECIVNACIHRDWTRSLDIEICLYSDRLEVISPGSLQNSMTIEKMKAGQRSPRNPLLVEVMRDYGYADSRGMGVRTKIIPLMRAINKTEPLFESTEDYLKVVLYK